MAKKISSELLGITFDPMPVEWDSSKVQLYAVAVGAKPPQELDFLYEGRGPKVLPTFGVVPGMATMAGLIANVEFNLAMLLHGEQSIKLHRPIPSNCHATAVGKISEVWDKGKAAVLGVEGEVSDKDGPIFTVHSTMFIRGAGGFGGERGPSTTGKNEPPAREPDYTVEDVTHTEQAALYRLTGDRNPIHIDPAFAQMGGYKEPFLHGLCTYGFVGRAALSALCGGNPERFISMEARFADQVYCSDKIISKFWIVGEGEAIVSAETQKGNIVLSQAKVTFKPE
jgi:acyl dehydratase